MSASSKFATLTALRAVSKRAVSSKSASADAVRTVRSQSKKEQTLLALAGRDALAERERSERFTAMGVAINAQTHAAAWLDAHVATWRDGHTCTSAECVAAIAAYESATRSLNAVFALPIIPSDIKSGGRFANKARQRMVTYASKIRIGSMLTTNADADDLVMLAVEYVYAHADDDMTRYPLTATPESRPGGFNAGSMVPTLGAMYRALPRVYALQLSEWRKTLAGAVVIGSLDATPHESVSRVLTSDSAIASVDPADIDWDKSLNVAEHYTHTVAKRRANRAESDAAERDAERRSARAIANERVSMFYRASDRKSLASSVLTATMTDAEAADMRVDLECIKLLADGVTLAELATELGITETTLMRRISGVRVGASLTAATLVRARRISRDKTRRREVDASASAVHPVTVRRVAPTPVHAHAFVSPIGNESKPSAAFALTDARRDAAVARFATMHNTVPSEPDAERVAVLNAWRESGYAESVLASA